MGAKNASRNGISQVVAYDSSVTVTNAFADPTRVLRLAANSACHYVIGNGVLTAAVTDAFLPANTIEYVACNPGQKIAAIKAATGGLVTATGGSLWVTELSQ